jgi:hypothetical protein
MRGQQSEKSGKGVLEVCFLEASPFYSLIVLVYASWDCATETEKLFYTCLVCLRIAHLYTLVVAVYL